MIIPILALGAASLLISWLATALMIRIAPRIGFVDRPGHRKIHSNPKPLGGGIAIVAAMVLPMILLLGYLDFFGNSMVRKYGSEHPVTPLITGAQEQSRLILGFIGGILAIHALGLLDDRRAMGPFLKFIIQLLIAGGMVIGFKMRAMTFLDSWGFGRALSVGLTVLWIVGITNAFNFLDNMDGLSSGVAAVCTTAFLVTTISIQQWFVAATLALLLGALLGFLWWNFPPAKIFMGDSGSLVIGFVLGVLTVRTTYLPAGQSFAAGWYAVFAPVIVLALPLYDLVVVSILRLSRGQSPFVGDTNHFSHRLVARGMSRRTAVLCLYLVTASTAIAAILLPHVQSIFGAVLIFSQTLLVLGVVALLEQHPLPAPDEHKP